ncbi:TetR/AcrR family transcriptional regulator [Klenkia terrae]
MTAARRSAADRRAQLVEIGLGLLPTTPVPELTIDEVARRAGISRSLLFHYFATKADYIDAVTRAAADLLCDHVLGDAGTGAQAGMLDRFVEWVETYRDSYVAFVRGAVGGDPAAATVYTQARERLVDGTLAVVGLPDDPRHRQLVRSWFAFTEDLVIGWTAEPTMSRDDVLALAADVLDRITGR